MVQKIETEGTLTQQINMIDGELVADRLGLKLRHGRCDCPTHHESKSGRTLGFHRRLNKWHCFSCGKNFSNIDLWMAIRRVEFRQALKELCDSFGIDFEPTRPGPVLDEIPEHVERSIGMKALLDRLKFYQGRKRNAQDYFFWECDMAMIHYVEYFEEFESGVLAQVYSAADDYFSLVDRVKYPILERYDLQMREVRQNLRELYVKN